MLLHNLKNVYINYRVCSFILATIKIKKKKITQIKKWTKTGKYLATCDLYLKGSSAVNKIIYGCTVAQYMKRTF